MENNSSVYSFKRRGSTFGSVITTLFYLAFILLFVCFFGYCLYSGEFVFALMPLAAVSLLMFSYLGYLFHDQAELILRFLEDEFIIEKRLWNRSFRMFRIKSGNIREFIYEPIPAIMTIDRTFFINSLLSPFWLSSMMFSYCVALRDDKNNTYFVNANYGKSDDKKRLRDELNRKLMDLNKTDS